MRIILLLLFILSIIVNINAQTYNNRTGGVITEIEKNKWTPINSVDSTGVLKVIWKEKYGLERSCYGRVVFDNGNEIKITAPWMENVYLYKNNIIDKKVVKLTPEEIPKELTIYIK